MVKFICNHIISFNNNGSCALFSLRWICILYFIYANMCEWLTIYFRRYGYYAMILMRINIKICRIGKLSRKKKIKAKRNVDNNLINDNGTKYVNNLQFCFSFIGKIYQSKWGGGFRCFFFSSGGTTLIQKEADWNVDTDYLTLLIFDASYGMAAQRVKITCCEYFFASIWFLFKFMKLRRSQMIRKKNNRFCLDGWSTKFEPCNKIS